MKLMPALPESVFDVGYLIFMTGTGIRLLKRSGKDPLIRLWGIMCLVLGIGDAFHLIPRVLRYWSAGDLTAALGLGKLITSVTMTVFYLILEYARGLRYPEEKNRGVLCSVWILSAVRVVLCLFPQNGWTSPEPPLFWGILRNAPFALLGVLTVILWYRSAREDKPLKRLWIAVALSFLFYFPVVLFAEKVPITGMLMLPKTCMYIWMALMFRKASAPVSE